jgi:protein-arginine kinase activator protein McsA
MWKKKTFSTMVLVKCEKCGYSWNTTSELLKITCPNCRKTTNNKIVSDKKE